MEHHNGNDNVSIAVNDVNGKTKETTDSEMLDIDTSVNDNEEGDFHEIEENTPNDQENYTFKNRNENIIETQSSDLFSEYNSENFIETESADLVNDQEKLTPQDQSENFIETESDVLEKTASVNGAELTEKTMDDENSEVARVEKTIPELKPPYVPRLPLSRIKNIMKLDPDPECSIFSQDSVYLITKAAELFIGYLSREAARNLTGIKRKTLMKKDVDGAIDAIPQLSFLDGVFE